MPDRDGIFAGSNPFEIFENWMALAAENEPNDPNAMAIASVDKDGLPNVRMVLLKDIEPDAFVFYTNYNSKKSEELKQNSKAAFVLHWKSIRRQIRVRGTVTLVEGEQADAYFMSRSLKSRQGAWASDQSSPLANREELVRNLEKVVQSQGEDTKRPPHWGGFRITPVEIEFWADGEARLHDRFRWTKENEGWSISRLNP